MSRMIISTTLEAEFSILFTFFVETIGKHIPFYIVIHQASAGSKNR